MKKIGLISVLTAILVSQIQGSETKNTQIITKLEDRKSIVVSKTDFKKYFSGGEVRIDPVYPKGNAKTHSGAYVTFGYTQTWDGNKEIVKEGDVVWCPIGVKHWHGASKDIAMTHLVITGAVEETGKNVEWLEPVTDKQYHSH